LPAGAVATLNMPHLKNWLCPNSSCVDSLHYDL
jgi:hypothetical protein